jgi:hypothetical protein
MTQISPGVVTREIDKSAFVPGVNTTVGAYCGVFRWGPLNEIVTLSNEGDLVSNFGTPDLSTATSFFTAARFLLYSDALRIVRAASIIYDDGNARTDVSTDGLELLGSGFLTGSPRLRPGTIIRKGSEEKTIVAVESDTKAILDDSFAVDIVDGESVLILTYIGTLNATANEGTGTDRPGIGVLIKNLEDYEINFSNGLADVGPFAAKCPGEIGNSLEVSVCPSASAFKQVLSGTLSSVGTIVTGAGTSFTTTISSGTILKDLATGQERKVVSVVSDTSLTVESDFSPALGASTVEAKWEFADAIGVAPETSQFALNVAGANDQLHVVVVDRGGQFTKIPGTILERHSFLSKASDAQDEDGTSSYYVNKINRNSSYVYWTDHIPAGVNWGSAAANTTFTAVNKPHTMRLTGGRDGNVGTGVDSARTSGYDLFADSDSVDISLLLAGEANTTIALKVLGLAESRQDCIAILSPEKDDVVSAPGREVDNVINFRNTLLSTSYGVMSSNWLYIYDKYRDTFVWVPDNGDLAGIVARSDVQSFPWIPPAGYNRGVLNEVVKLAWNPRKAARDDLYLAGVNFVISQAGSGPVWLGDKTLLNRPSAFDRINVRRLFIVLRKSISEVAKGLIHELNDDITRNSFKNQVEPFLKTVQTRRGIIDSRVICDGTNNTGDVIDRNEFVADIYIKPSKSINFITLNFVATRSGVSFNEIVGRL